ncbi:hypothetical protein HPB48_012530 [Haemaphysalis longicornis]|uniref:HAT C-terminal dimerisation domain-containing protein n=1 Tax=Haemaphysalis longicornis TaxID=44386 RepID=A0A9J6GLL5_HAELO|nr:hypothetical protein HPB48_012530 [Haemaphysalis longicornis]
MKTEPNILPRTGSDALPHSDEKFYPNLYKLLEILVLLPITTALAERTFSSFILLKNYLRSTMSERDRVRASVYSHREITISASDVIDRIGQRRRRFGFIV